MSTERGYINTRLGFPETGYSESPAYIFWSKSNNWRYYIVNIVCRAANIAESRFSVIDDFGNLVVLP